MVLTPACSAGVGGFGSGLGGFGAFGLLGLILNLVITVGLIVGLVLLIVWLWRRVNSGGQGWTDRQQPTETENSSKEILQVRYARGEITREQYQQMLVDLSQ
jgi:uncharacterized membrane protein